MGMAREHFVLVHGEGHGGWCWFKLRWLLEGSGYRVTCIDLAGGGVDPTDPNTIQSFTQYNKPLIDLLSALPEGEKVYMYMLSSFSIYVPAFIISLNCIYWLNQSVTVQHIVKNKLLHEHYPTCSGLQSFAVF